MDRINIIFETDPIEIEVIPVGIQGAKGADGISNLIKIPFTYGEVSRDVYSLDVGKTLLSVSVSFQTAFNGVSSAVSVGTAQTPELFMSFTQNSPYMTASFESTVDDTFTVPTSVFLNIIPGSGCTQGSGLLVLEVV